MVSAERKQSFIKLPSHPLAIRRTTSALAGRNLNLAFITTISPLSIGRSEMPQNSLKQFGELRTPESYLALNGVLPPRYGRTALELKPAIYAKKKS